MLPTTSQKAEPTPQRTPINDKPARQRSLLESWAVIPAKTRLRISLAITGFALAGLFVSDQLEKWVPAQKPVENPKAS